MKNDIQYIMFTEEQIKTKVAELGGQLMDEYAGKNPLFIGVLKGVVPFFADMMRAFEAPCEIDFMWISSYQGTTSTGNMLVRKDVTQDIRGRHVVILEDIFDTGHSLDFTYKHLLAKGPASLKICTFLDKPERRKPNITLQADFTGYVIPNEFVVGYGLDFNEKYRNLPYIGVLKPEAYEK